MAVKSWKRASWRESVVELGVQRIADQQSAIIIGGLGKEEKKGASKGGAEGQRERDREVGERGQKKKGERKGENGERERERERELRGTMKSLTGRSEHNAPWSTLSAPTTDPPHNPTRIVRPINIVLYRES